MTGTHAERTTYNVLYGGRIHDLDLVRRDTDERAIAFVQRQLVVLTSSISHSTEIPQWRDTGPEGTWKVFVWVEIAVVYGATKAVQHKSSDEDLGTQQGLVARQDGRQQHGVAGVKLISGNSHRGKRKLEQRCQGQPLHPRPVCRYCYLAMDQSMCGFCS